jgi:hypothetical protein
MKKLAVAMAVAALMIGFALGMAIFGGERKDELACEPWQARGYSECPHHIFSDEVK